MSSLTLSANPAPAYHWTGANQRRFLETLAQTGVVSLAAKAVTMSAQAAYDFRQRGAGRVFALGWLAAILVSRDRLVDDLMERAFLGQEEELIRDPDNNRLVRKRSDNRLGMGMLARLDRMVEAAAGVGQGDAFTQSARLVAGDFERFLDLVEREGGGHEAGLFLASHAAGENGAFHYQLPQNPESFAEDGDVDDAGVDAMLIADPSPEAHAACLSVWWDDDAEEWRTDFPPPQDFDGDEEGRYGEDDYQRTLTEAEAAVQDARKLIEERPYVDAAHAARAAYFAPEPQVKAEMRRRQAQERTAQKAAQKAADKAQAAQARLAEKRRRTDEKLARLAEEAEAREMQPRPALAEDELEVKAVNAPEWQMPNEAVADDSTVIELQQTVPGYRTIPMPQKPRPLFGIYGDRPPHRDPVW